MKKPLSISQKALNLWAVILIVWSVYRYNLRMPDWFDELIAKPLIFVLPVYFFVKKIEKKNFFKAISFDKNKVGRDIFFSLIMVLIFLASAILGLYFKKQNLNFNINQYQLKQLFLVVILALATGVSEEILFRGFVLKRLLQESKNVLSASFFTSILFFFLHVPILFTNIKIVGSMLLMIMITDIALSFALSLIFIYQNSLLLVILIHAFYNLTLTLFL